MGLAPLAQQTQEDIAAEQAQYREAEAEARRKAEQAETEALRAELAARKQKRADAAKLESVPSLGAALSSVSGGSAADWVNRSRQIGMSEAAKAHALKQAQLKKEQAKADYHSSELRGLKVKHSSEQFSEGESVILTLKDTTILKGGFGSDGVNDEEDVLENLQLSEAEKMARAQDSKQRAKQAAYDVYGEANVLLEQYEDEQEKARREEEANSMRIGDDMVSEKKRRAALLGQADTADEPDGMGPKKTLYSLDFEKKLASDYKEPKFKKRVKKEKDGSGKKKVRKALVDDELYAILAEPAADQRALDLGSRASRSAQEASEAAKQALKDQSYLKAMKKAEEQTKRLLVEARAAFEDDDEEAAKELRQSIERARRLKDSKAQAHASSVERLAAEVRAKKEQTSVKTEEDAEMDVDGASVKQEQKEEKEDALVFTSTSEFCRGLEDAREDEEEEEQRRRQRAQQRQMEREAEEKEREQEREREQNGEGASGWVKAESKAKEEEPRVKIEDEDLDEDRDDDDEHEDVSMSVKKEEGEGDEDEEGADEDEVAFLSDEPALDGGLGAALKMAKLRGFLHQESEQIGRAQDKEFRLRAEEDPAPNIKLEYLDEFGRELKPKEAFRLLSHKFHGKGPSARKAEKKLKLLQEAKKRRDAAAKDMANTGLVAKLKKKQHQTGQAFVVLDDKLTPTSLNSVSRNAEESSAREGQAQRRGKASGSASTVPGAKTPAASRKRKHE